MFCRLSSLLTPSVIDEEDESQTSNRRHRLVVDRGLDRLNNQSYSEFRTHLMLKLLHVLDCCELGGADAATRVDPATGVNTRRRPGANAEVEREREARRTDISTKSVLRNITNELKEIFEGHRHLRWKTILFYSPLLVSYHVPGYNASLRRPYFSRSSTSQYSNPRTNLTLGILVDRRTRPPSLILFYF